MSHMLSSRTSRVAHLVGLALVLVLVLALAGVAQAHRVKVFAYSDSETIFTESNFSKASPAMNSDIVVTDAAGKTVFSGKTDDQGKCDFPVPKDAVGDLTIQVIAGEGHQGDWVLTEGEYK